MVLRCLARGLSNNDISLQLSISLRSVHTHVRNILEKPHLGNRTQAALYAVKLGLGSQWCDVISRSPNRRGAPRRDDRITFILNKIVR